MESLPFALLAGIFVACAAAIWISGVWLSNETDVLSSRFHLGSALGGLILLAIATNLPEVAITVSGALSGDVSVAVGNILGGIAIQTVVLVILDIGAGDRPLTYKAASLSILVEAIVVVAVLAVVIAGSQLPEGLVFARLTPDAVLITVIWVLGLLLVRRSGKSMPWRDSGQAPGSQEAPRGHSRAQKEKEAKRRGRSTAASAAIFAGAAAITLVAGVFLERSGSAMAGQVGLSGVLFGATVLALATSLPEISTGLASVRAGDYKLAMSDIFGGNAFLPVLFLVATLLSGKSVLPNAHATDIYLTALGMVLTIVYALGVLFRPRRQFLRMGIDSIVVLVLYAVGVVGLFAVAGSGG